MRRSVLLLPIALVALFLISASLFIVDEREKGLVLQFGRVVGVKEEPGLFFKVPFIQEVVKYEDRILSLDTQPLCWRRRRLVFPACHGFARRPEPRGRRQSPHAAGRHVQS